MADHDGGQGALTAAATNASAPRLGAKPPGRRGPARLMPMNWRMRWRVLAIVLIPTVAALSLGSLRIEAAQSTADAAARTGQLAALGGDVTTLAEAVEDERDLTAGYVATRQAGHRTTSTALLGKLRAQYAVTDADVTTVEAAAKGIGPAFPANATSDLTALLASLSGLSELRVLANTDMAQLALTTHYSAVIATLLQFDNDIAAGSSDPTLEQTVIAFATLAQVEEQASQQRAILFADLETGSFGLGDLAALTSAQSTEASDLAEFETEANNLPAFVPGAGLSTGLTLIDQFNNTFTGAQIDASDQIEDNVTATGVLPAGLAPTWFSDMTVKLDAYRSVESDEIGSITAQANAEHQGAENSRTLTAVVVLAILLLVLLVTNFMSRSLIIPLRRLRADALDVAGRRLPDMVRRLSETDSGQEVLAIEPIGINSTEEIGEVARAFDQVHREAVRLAGDEAMLRANLNAMFVNLSRRSQSLIERQLGIIDSLEQSEQDPDRLSHLFRLDHLATRMRRNSENLLVLAGHETPRKWSEPVPLVDVLRAAISEIEQYEKIALNAQPGIVVSGRAASDVVHLVAELVENASTFSPDDTTVLVTAQQIPSGGVLLDITDSGLGIPAEELAYANWRLDNPPVVDVAVSRRMGLFVVGRLASRHGIRVRLKHVATGGVSALIWLPDTLAESENEPTLGGLRRRFVTDGYGTPDTVAMRQGAMTPRAPAPVPAQAVVAPRPTGPAPRWPSAQEGQGTPGSGGSPWVAFPPPRSAGTPATGQPLASSPASPASAAEAAPDVPPDVTGPRLPIFDAVESDWFRRGSGSRAGNGAPAGPGAPAAPSAGPGARAWTSPADDGFRAARAVASPTADETTGAGLPKRVPQAHLVPGSVGGGAPRAGNQVPAADPAAHRPPEEARSRMTDFQRGSREGRAAAPPSYLADES